MLHRKIFSDKSFNSFFLRTNKHRYGTCKSVEPCPAPNLIFWHVDEKCYKKYTQGPCPKGKLLTVGPNGLAKCLCSDNEEMKKFYWSPEKSCHEHFTRGPCQEKGHLFLPYGKCDCNSSLQQYDFKTDQCYELGKKTNIFYLQFWYAKNKNIYTVAPKGSNKRILHFFSIQ